MARRPSSSELTAWGLVGLGLGLVAGIALGGWLGPVDQRRVRRAIRRLHPAGEGPAHARPAEVARTARLALARDTQLKDLGLQVLPVGPGVMELHGWVPSRSIRARAARLVAGQEGVDSLVNCLLVRGEDDTADPLDATDQPA